jgi:hyperosmotically inducible periplasmic protein
MTVRHLLGVLGLTALAVSCAQTDPGITTSVKARLGADELVRARQIDVDTKDRVVTLTGVVSRADEEAKALDIARNTKGVIDVVDNITVSTQGDQAAPAPTTGRFGEEPPATGETAAMTDAGITARVKTRLLADPMVSGLKIDVDTREHVVTLTGTVGSQAEKARAVELAKKDESVKRVEDRLTVRASAP